MSSSGRPTLDFLRFDLFPVLVSLAADVGRLRGNWPVVGGHGGLESVVVGQRSVVGSIIPAITR